MTPKMKSAVGIDVGKDCLDVFIMPQSQQKRFSNDDEGIESLVAWISDFEPHRIIVEATGIYHRNLLRALEELPAVTMNPGQIRSFAKALGKRAKTDKIDAEVLARYGMVMSPEVRPLKSARLEILSEHLSVRRALIAERTALKNQLRTLSVSALRDLFAEKIARITAEISDIDASCTELVKSDPELYRRSKYIESIPGIGKLTVYALLALMPELGSLTNKEVAALAGLAPQDRQSGKWVGRSFIQGGRSLVRRALYMPAITAIQYNMPMKLLYERLTKAGKPPKVALVAVMRKMLITANCLVRDSRTWKLTN